MRLRRPWGGREAVQREGFAEPRLGQMSWEGARGAQLPTTEKDESQRRQEEQWEVTPSVDGRVVGEEASGSCERRSSYLRGGVGEG